MIDQMKNPLVSVIVTNYNYSLYLPRCINSILQQTYENIEIIVCDNNSSDTSFELVTKIANEHPGRITCLRHRKNFGSAANYISGEQLARGSYLINFGADDYMLPNFVATAIRLFNEYPKVGQIVSHTKSIDDHGSITCRPPFFDDSYLIKGEKYAEVLMLAGITAHTSQTILSYEAKSYVKTQQGYISSPTIGERSEAMMLALHYDVIFIHEPMLVCRDSDTNETHRLNLEVSQIFDQVSLINSFVGYAETNDISGVKARKTAAYSKLSELSKRYAVDFKSRKICDVSLRYLLASILLDPNLDLHRNQDGDFDIEQLLQFIRHEIDDVSNRSRGRNVGRQHSYAPPENSHRISILNS
jgi:glycosyltransferase involved in cell wall biosynthesis